MILDGKKIAIDIYEDLKNQVSQLKEKPSLGIILIWEDPASLRYIKQKQKWAEYIGIDFRLSDFSVDTPESELIKKVHELNNNTTISGFMIQTPLPETIDTDILLSAISPEKDVDGFHPINQWKLLIGDTSWLIACTPAGIIKLLETKDIAIAWAAIVVLWKSNIVGKPITQLLINAWATVTSCNSQTPDISRYTKHADIVITATGVPGILGKKDIWKHTVVIDVWFYIQNDIVSGDAIFE